MGIDLRVFVPHESCLVVMFGQHVRLFMAPSHLHFRFPPHLDAYLFATFKCQKKEGTTRLENN